MRPKQEHRHETAKESIYREKDTPEHRFFFSLFFFRAPVIDDPLERKHRTPNPDIRTEQKWAASVHAHPDWSSSIYAPVSYSHSDGHIFPWCSKPIPDPDCPSHSTGGAWDQKHGCTQWDWRGSKTDKAHSKMGNIKQNTVQTEALRSSGISSD